MKENDGKAARRTAGRMILWVFVLHAALVLSYFLFQVEESTSQQTKSYSRSSLSSASYTSPEAMKATKGSQQTTQESLTFNSVEDAILKAEYFLVDISMNSKAVMKRKGESAYDGVIGHFCSLDWKLQKENPSTVPMFKDLVGQSKGCRRNNQVQYDLKAIADKARIHDQYEESNVHAMEIGGFVFHETRCGSTLVANLLAASNPEAHRVYSESPPPLTALTACDSLGMEQCDTQKADSLLRDVLYLMGRSRDPREQHVFYKIQSVGVRSISSMTRALPTVPWMFVYRDSVEIMMSHFKTGDSTKQGGVCLRALHQPPPILIDLVQDLGRTVPSLSKAEFCAAHLASLCESAIREHDATDKGQFVQYASLPDIMWESVLPEYLGITLTDSQIDHMKEVSGFYSKGRGPLALQEWEEDSQRKHELAPVDIEKAAQTFLLSSWNRMNALSTQQL